MPTQPNIPAVSSERCFNLTRPVWARSEGDMSARSARETRSKKKRGKEKKKKENVAGKKLNLFPECSMR